jgi:tripartite-type tricarboxylate transporter receptor subunit TctC
MRKLRSLGNGFLWCVLVGLLASEASAQAYPARPIRVIDTFAPGGSTDIVARTIAPKFQESQGQPWVVDNRPGAQGIIGAEIAAKARGDGYTLLMFTDSMTILPSMYKNLPFDVQKTFVPVTQTSAVAYVLVVTPALPTQSVKELIALAKSKPGQLKFAAGGSGPQMTAELFNSMAGTSMTHVPYKGGALAVLATIAGETDLLFATMPTAAQYIRSGKLRALAVCGAKRTSLMAELPTISEAGLPGFESTHAVGVLAPAGTPRPIVDKLQQEIARILSMPEIRERLLVVGLEPALTKPDQFAEYIRTDMAKWARVMKDRGMEPQIW